MHTHWCTCCVVCGDQFHLRASHGYFEGGKQPHVSSVMRTILVDWMVEVHGRFKLKQETIHIAITIMDRYFGKPHTWQHAFPHNTPLCVCVCVRVCV